MRREYLKWHSRALGRDMEMLVFGHAGQPAAVFPTSRGRFFDYEERGMVEALRPALDNGQLELYCVDSIDKESWYNERVHPAARAARHAQYDRYVESEVLGFIQTRNAAERLTVTGCSFGGYHSINFALRYPWKVNAAISLGGAFDIRRFVDGHYDDNCYFHCPPDFLPGLEDRHYLDAYRGMRIVLATGENDTCLGENLRLSEILHRKQVPHHLDVWRAGTGHDWQWWRDMARKFFL